MKKFVITAWIIVLSIWTGFAQDPSFSTDSSIINVGVGIGSTLYSGYGYHNLIPPISFSYEKGIKDGVLGEGSIGLGAYVGYASSKWEYTDSYGTYGWKYANTIIGARGSFHYPLVENLDTYVGIMLGYDIVSTKYTSTDYYEGYNYTPAVASGFIWSGYLGGRYWFNEKMGLMGELGYGIAYLNLGMAFNL